MGLPGSRDVGGFLYMGPGFLFGLFFLAAATDRPYLDLVNVHFCHVFLFGALTYLLAFIVIAASSRSLDFAGQAFFPKGQPAHFSIMHCVVLALFSLTWGANVGLATNLVKGIGANQAMQLTGHFVRYQRYPKSNCGNEAVFSTSLGELELCNDGFPSKIHPRLPIDALLASGEPVVLTGRKNRLVFIPEKVTRLIASP